MTPSIATESWIALSIAILFGVLGTLSIKISHGLSKLKPIICICIFYVISFVALTFAIKHIELSVVYAVWSGVGTLLMAAIGMIYFSESVSLKKIVFLLLIIVGIIGIHSA